jgi:hypothetical protein
MFRSAADVWPQSHSDLLKPVYHSNKINPAVKEVLSVEFVTAFSAIKGLLTCPEEVYQLLLKITALKTAAKNTNQFIPIVNSTKSLGCFTLNFCSKEKLLAELNSILVDISEKKGKNSNLTKIAKSHNATVSFLKLLDAIVKDLTTGDHKNDIFKQKIGFPNREGFYKEDNFIEV